jgi:hypothetical protein
MHLKDFGGVLCVVGILGFTALGDTAQASRNGQNVCVSVDYPAVPAGEPLLFEITLLDDSTDLAVRLTTLQNESKPLLEPLVKDYMYAAEYLTRIAASTSEEKTRFLRQFRTSEQQIERILDTYHQQLETLLEQAAIISQQAPTVDEALCLPGVSSGVYRVYAELSFSTTQLRWFEALQVKGGGDASVTLTRDNLKNPYWTDLNWWKFINLDFSKHH